MTGELPSHTHTGTTTSNGSHYHQAGDGVNGLVQGGTTGSGPASLQVGGGSFYVGFTDTKGSHTHTFTSDATGSGVADSKVQPSLVVNWMIKT